MFLKVINHDHHSNFTLSVPLGYFHNPYFYEHMRLDVNINPIPIFVEPGGTSDWVDAGALLDTQVRPRPRSAPRPFRGARALSAAQRVGRTTGRGTCHAATTA